MESEVVGHWMKKKIDVYGLHFPRPETWKEGERGTRPEEWRAQSQPEEKLPASLLKMQFPGPNQLEWACPVDASSLSQPKAAHYRQRHVTRDASEERPMQQSWPPEQMGLRRGCIGKTNFLTKPVCNTVCYSPASPCLVSASASLSNRSFLPPIRAGEK